MIEGDGDFTSQNGVVAGNGTPGDPFVIAGWEMLLTGPPGVEIRNTTAFFVIRDLILVGSFDGAFDAVILRNVTNARIENVTSEFNRIGILLDGVRSVTIERNQLHGNHRGIHLYSSMDVTVSRNNASGGPLGHHHFLVVDSNRVTIESNRIVPTYGVAIAAAISRDVNIVNNTVQSTQAGILFEEVTDTTVASNRFSWGGLSKFRGPGFDIRFSSNLSLTANWFHGYAIDFLDGSANVTLQGNYLPGYLYGFGLNSSRDIVLANNTMDRGGLRITGSDLRDFVSHRIEPTNTVAGRPIAYLRECGDLDMDGLSIAQVIVVSCERVRLANLTLSKLAVGIHIVGSRDVVVENTTMVDTFDGVLGEASTNISVVNTSVSLGAFGIHLVGSAGFSLRRNRIWNIPQEIFLEWTADGEVVGNYLMESSNVGLAVRFGQRVLVSRNNVTGNHWGISVSGSTNVVVEGNTIGGNDEGLVVGASEGIRIHHNEFLGNHLVQARDHSGTTNQWDNGYPSGGNFWSDYRGWDDCGGPAQDVCPGSDGLGDIPYDLGGGVKDRYPLVRVNPTNELPLASFSYAPAILAPGIQVTFDARSSFDPEGFPLRYSWNFGDGTIVDTMSPTIDHTYLSSRTFTVTLTVTDPRGGTSTHARSVTVGYRPVASFTFSPTNPKAGEQILFDASASYDPDGTIYTLEWSLGDGLGYSPNAQMFSYIYQSPGTYVVELTVRDDMGLMSKAIQTIAIAPPAPPSPPFSPSLLVAVTTAGSIIAASVAVLIVLLARSRSKRSVPPVWATPDWPLRPGPAPSASRSCTRCGVPASPHATFCGNCGDRLR